MIKRIISILYSLFFPPKGGKGVFLLLLCVLLASCGSRKRAVTSTTVTPAVTPETTTPAVAKPTTSPFQNIVKTVNANRHSEKYVTAKINLSLSSGDKKTSVGGTLRMKRNDVIQVSLVGLGILEVAKLEITPDYFMVIDKVGKQYLKAAYQDVPFLSKVGVDFYTLQALFWDELFLFGGSTSVPTDKQFKKAKDGEKARLTNSDSKYAVLSFLVGLPAGHIQQTTVSPHAQNSSPYLTWKYSDFGNFAGKSFPTGHNVTVANGTKPIKANLSLSNLKNDANWETRTETPGRRYTEVTADKLVSRILSLTK